jgi:predicted TIM-barrel fold metal-dependent hydrolase
MIIDIHVHIFEERMWCKKFLDEVYELKRKTLTPEEFKKYKVEATTDMLIKDMDAAGVDIAVCLPIDFAFIAQQEAEISIWKANEYVAEAQDRYPDRIIGFVGVDPQRPDASELLEKGVKDWGLKGIKIYPGNFYPTDERVEHFFAKANELRLPVLFHSGVDPYPFLTKYGNPEYLDDLTLKYRNLKIIAAHFARGWHDLLAELMVYRPNRIWTDIAAMQYEYTASRWHFFTNLRYFLDRAPNAVLMGSDWPFPKNPPQSAQPSYKEWVELFKNLSLPDVFLSMGMKQFSTEERKKILGGNAQQLLGL